MVLLGLTASSIRQLLKICEEYAVSHGLVYNSKKNEFVVFRAVGRMCPDSISSITHLKWIESHSGVLISVPRSLS